MRLRFGWIVSAQAQTCDSAFVIYHHQCSREPRPTRAMVPASGQGNKYSGRLSLSPRGQTLLWAMPCRHRLRGGTASPLWSTSCLRQPVGPGLVPDDARLAAAFPSCWHSHVARSPPMLGLEHRRTPAQQWRVGTLARVAPRQELQVPRLDPVERVLHSASALAGSADTEAGDHAHKIVSDIVGKIVNFGWFRPTRDGTLGP